MLDGGTAIVRVIADASKLSTTIAAATRGSTGGLAGLGNKISSALTNPLVLAGGVVAGVTAKMGYDFEDAFARIDAISNASSQDIAKWRTQVMTLGKETAQSPTDLAEALYFLASAGLKANEVFPALEASAKAATVGLGDAAQVGSVVAAVLNAYAGSGIKAADVTDILFAAVRESRAETDEFGQTLGRLLPISARAGISFGELAGSLASLSNIGLDVYEASTAMRGAIQAITAPGAKAANTMNEMGISSQHMLDTIHEDGLLGALKYLDKQIKANTKSESEYLRAFRDIIPNVRALTGVLGLTGANLKHVNSIFDATTHATGDMAEGLDQISRGPAFKFREALNELRIIGIQVGQNILPPITDIISTLAPVLEFAAKNADKLLIAFLGYKALGFLPGLLTSIGVAMQVLGVSWDVAALDAAGIKLVAWTKYALKGAVATFALAYALGDQSSVAQTSTTEMRDLTAGAELYHNALAKGTLTQEDYNAYLSSNLVALHGNREAFELAVDSGMSYEDALFQISATGMEGAQHVKQVNKSVRQSAVVFDEAGNKVKTTTHSFQRWGFATAEAFQKFKEGLQESIQTAPGAFETLADAFSVTPEEAEKQLSLALQITRTKIRDLKRIMSDKDLTRGQKLALASLAPEYRHAFVEAGDAGKRAILKLAGPLAAANATNVNRIMAPTKKMKGKAETAGRSVGTGVATGITATTPAAIAAAAHLVNVVNSKMKDLWKFGSPSKVTHQFGAWLVEGLILGIKSRESALKNTIEHVTDILKKALDNAKSALSEARDKNVGIAAAEATVAIARERVKQAHELEKMANQAQKALDKIIDKFKEFKSSIRDGFSDFKDLGSTISDAWSQYQQDLEEYQQAMKDFVQEYDEQGKPTNAPPTAPTAPNLSGLIEQQVADAKRLAKDLIDAAKAGLSKGLLQQFASQGVAGANALEQLLANPELIAQLNDAYKVINDAANDTADALGAKFFGKAIREATHEFNNAVHVLQKFIIAMIKAMADVGGASASLRALLANLQQKMQNAPAGGGGGGGGGGSGGGNGPGPGNNWGTGWGGGWGAGGNTPPAPPWKPTWEPTWEPEWKPNKKGDVYVTVNGDVTGTEVVRKVRDELLRIGRNNGGTGL